MRRGRETCTDRSVSAPAIRDAEWAYYFGSSARVDDDASCEVATRPGPKLLADRFKFSGSGGGRNTR